MADLAERMRQLVALIEVTPEEVARMAEVRGAVEAALTAGLPAAGVTPFGSSACGLGLRNCDLDLCVEGMKGLERRRRTEAVAGLLRRHSRFRDLQVITGCRTPIVRLADRRTGVRCDVSACSRMGVHNTRYVRHCLGSEPRARTLAMVVKCFARRHGITGTGPGDHLNSYSLALRVIFFLQTRGLLHPLAVLRQVPGIEDVTINDYDFSYCSDPSLLPALAPHPATAAELLHGFLRYFAAFDYRGAAVSLEHGLPLARAGLAAGGPLVVLDPFEVGRSVTAGVSGSRLAVMTAAMGTAAGLLDSLHTAEEHRRGNFFLTLMEPGFPEFPDGGVEPGGAAEAGGSLSGHRHVIQPGGSRHVIQTGGSSHRC